MRPRTLLVLFLLVAALGAFIWFFERDLPGSDERAELEKRLLSLETEEITELVIERAGETVRLRRPAPAEETEGEDDDLAPAKREWRLLEPYAARADTAAADRLADTLALLEKERTLEDYDPAAVGLEAPRATVTVRSPKREATVTIGAEIPASSTMVVAAGSEAAVVADSVWPMLSKEPGEWRSRELFALHRGAVERVELDGAGERVVLAKRGEAFWLESPIEDLAEDDTVQELLDAMYTVEVDEFLDAPELSPAAMGLEPEPARLVVHLTGVEEPAVVEVGAPVADDEELRYARVDRQLATVGDGLDEALGREPVAWQATSWTLLEVFEIDSFRVVDEAGELLLERSGADWTRDGVRIAYAPVSDFLYALTGASGERLLERAAAAGKGVDLSSPSVELTLAGSEGEETLSLYEGDGGYLAGRSGRAYLLELSAGTVEDLRLKLQAVRDEEPLAAAEGEDEEG